MITNVEGFPYAVYMPTNNKTCDWRDAWQETYDLEKKLRGIVDKRDYYIVNYHSHRILQYTSSTPVMQ